MQLQLIPTPLICEQCGVPLPPRSLSRIRRWAHHYCSQACQRMARAAQFVKSSIIGEGSLRVRFWSHVPLGELDDCWEWQGKRSPQGYGNFGLGSRKIGAHRLAWMLLFGWIPDGQHALHECDNPPCCNPWHIFLGTDADNVADMILKGRGRWARGEAQGFAKLTAVQVVEIRERHAAGGVTLVQLAAEFKVHPNTVGAVVQRKTWRHV